MIQSKKLLSMVLALVMALSMVAIAQAETAATDEGMDKPFVVGYSNFSSKFSPFFHKTDYDKQASDDMTQLLVNPYDRQGNPLLKGIEGEVRPYNGVDHTYYGASDVEVTFDKDANLTTYDIQLRNDLKFSDGEPVTIDDVIFSMYVLIDPTYDGGATLNTVDIVGRNNYATQTTSDVFEKYSKLANDLLAAGDAHEWAESDAWTKEQQDWFNDHLKALWIADAQSIVDYVQANYLPDAAGALGVKEAAFEGNTGLQVAAGMVMWGFGEVNADTKALVAPSGKSWTLQGDDFPTIEDYYSELYAAYEGNPAAYWATEATGDTPDLTATAKSDFIGEWGPKDESMSGGIANVEGFKRIDDYHMQVIANGFDAAAIYQVTGTPIAPLHYYGDKAQYDFENNKFGFPFGDLSIVKEKTTQPLGAGPYIFKSFENKVIYYEANPYYFMGEPKTKYVQFKETLDNDKVSGVMNGTIDASEPSLSKATADEIKSYNSNGEMNGDKIIAKLVDNLGYGYIGINANTVSVAGDAASDASKNLRKAFATMLSAYRDVAVNSYYGERASVINYPISNTSWAAPQKSDPDYRVAYSLGVDGSEIYTDDMSVDQKNEAALKAAVEYLKAAGYTFDDATGKFTAAPDGAKLDYEIIIPAEGVGNHPSFQILTDVKAALETIGITLTINDPTDSNVLWNKIENGTQEMWCAAWQATPDPDMYQVYHSSNAVGKGGTDSNSYMIADPELDQLIVDARTSPDQAFRKATYKLCLDKIMDWAVEIPIYQRQNVQIFSTERVNIDTITPDITTFWYWYNDLEKLEMNT